MLNANKALVRKLQQGIALRPNETNDLRRMPASLLICYLNGFDDAQELMQESRPWLKQQDKMAYQSLKEGLRILRKVRYS